MSTIRVQFALLFTSSILFCFSSAVLPPTQRNNAWLLFNKLFCKENVTKFSGFFGFDDFMTQYPINGTTIADFDVFVKFLEDSMEGPGSDGSPSEYAQTFATILYAFMNGGDQFAQMSFSEFKNFRSSLGWKEVEGDLELLFEGIAFTDCNASLNNLMGGEAFNYFTTSTNTQFAFTIPGGESKWTAQDMKALSASNNC